MATVAQSNPGIDGFSLEQSLQVSDEAPSLVVVGFPGQISATGIIASDGAAATQAARVDGIIGESTLVAGERTTLLTSPGVIVKWSKAGLLIKGNTYYLASGGGIDDAPSIGDANGTFVAIDAYSLKWKGSSL